MPKKTESDAFSQYPEALGFYGGRISGSGLTYHRWNDNKGYQITAGVIYIPPLSNENSAIQLGDNMLDYVVGFENAYVVYSEDFTGWLSGLLSLFWGVNHRGYWPVETTDYETGAYTIHPYVPTITLGGGIGIEILLFKHFSIPFEIGYGVTYFPLEADPVDMFLVNLYPQAGFRYRY